MEQWRRLALDGSDIPIRIHLDGDSMRPLIRRQQDMVTIVPLRRELRRGDIVLFADDAGRYVVHRVWRLAEAQVTTLGDHCRRPDPPLRRDQVWGLVIRVERGKRTLRVDQPVMRLLGRIWMALLPVRIGYASIRNGCRKRRSGHGRY